MVELIGPYASINGQIFREAVMRWAHSHTDEEVKRVFTKAGWTTPTEVMCSADCQIMVEANKMEEGQEKHQRLKTAREGSPCFSQR